MMKKIIAITLVIAAAMVIFFGASQVFAKDFAVPPGPNPDEPGIGPRRFERGRLGYEHGFLHDYMFEAMAAEFELTIDELTTLHESGKTLWDLTQVADLTVEEFQSKMTAAREAALNAAVEDGAIDQEQADWMIEHMNKIRPGEFEPGNGPCHGGNFDGEWMHGKRGGHGMGRW